MNLLSSQIAQGPQQLPSEVPAQHVTHGGIVFSAVSPSFFPGSSIQSWIVDSGASSHIACSESNFLVSKYLSNYYINLPDKSQIPVKDIGFVNFSIDFVLKNVLLVPSFHVNLISISALLANSCYHINFTNGSFYI